MPSPNPATRREHAGAASPATLTGTVAVPDLSFSISTNTGWPTGGTGVFFVVIDAGNGSEEKIRCITQAGSVVTVDPGGRGADGTIAKSHGIGASVYPVWTAVEADELNAHANAINAVHGVAGNVVGTTDTQTLTGKTILAASNVFDAAIDSLGALTPAADQLPYYTGAAAAALTSFTTQARQLLDDTSFGAMLTTLGAQPLDAELTALAGLTSAADRLPYFTGSGAAALQNFAAAARSLLALTAAADRLPYFDSGTTAALATFTSFARTLVDDIDQAAARVTLGLTPGTDVQAFDSGLAALAAFNTNGLLVQTANNTFAGRSITSTASTLTVTFADGVSNNPNLELKDGGWINGNTGFTAGTNFNFDAATCRYRVLGGIIVHLHAEVARNSVTVITAGNIANLAIFTAIPAAIRPSVEVACSFKLETAGAGIGRIDTDGSIDLYATTADINDNDVIVMDACYFLGA